MFPRTKMIIAAALAAGPIAFLTPPEATAQERITLETIGAVRMARFEEFRGANQELRPPQATPARDPVAERPAKPR